MEWDHTGLVLSALRLSEGGRMLSGHERTCAVPGSIDTPEKAENLPSVSSVWVAPRPPHPHRHLSVSRRAATRSLPRPTHLHTAPAFFLSPYPSL